MPAGKAFRRFLVFDEGRPSNLVAGTCSKYGSFDSKSVAIWIKQKCTHRDSEITHLHPKIILRGFPKDLFANVFCERRRHDGGIDPRVV